MKLPNIEDVSAKVHEQWMETKRSQSVTSRKSESGEELMVPYADLSEAAKELDRGTVRTVYAAIETLSQTAEDPEGDGLTKGQATADVPGDVLGI